MIRRDLSAAIAAHVRLHERTCQLEDEHHRGIHRARQALARTRSVDAFQRWRTAACHGSGLHGPVDASSVGLRCIKKVQQPSCLLELSPVPLRTASRTCPLSLGFVIRKGHELAFRTTYEGLSILAPRVLAVLGLDARAKKRKSGFDLCFSFRNVPAKIVGAGRAEVLENLFFIHKPSKSSHLTYGNT